MTILTIDEIAQAAYDSGPFRGESVAYITACAMAESGGNTMAISPPGESDDGTCGFGLVQIEGGPGGYAGVASGNVNGGDWESPVWQMQKAFAMSYAGNNFNDWCTACAPMPGLVGGKGCGGYGSGNAVRFLQAAYAAAAQVHVGVAEPNWPGVDLRILNPLIVGHGTGLWQARMNVLSEAVLAVDGVYGLKTQGATEHYQTDHGLLVDGVVGPLTWTKAFA